MGFFLKVFDKYLEARPFEYMRQIRNICVRTGIYAAKTIHCEHFQEETSNVFKGVDACRYEARGLLIYVEDASLPENT